MRTDSERTRELGTQLKKRRTEANISQDELSNMTGIDKSYISKLENGLRNTSVVEVYRYIEAIGDQRGVTIRNELITPPRNWEITGVELTQKGDEMNEIVSRGHFEAWDYCIALNYDEVVYCLQTLADSKILDKIDPITQKIKLNISYNNGVNKNYTEMINWGLSTLTYSKQFLDENGILIGWGSSRVFKSVLSSPNQIWVEVNPDYRNNIPTIIKDVKNNIIEKIEIARQYRINHPNGYTYICSCLFGDEDELEDLELIEKYRRTINAWSSTEAEKQYLKCIEQELKSDYFFDFFVDDVATELYCSDDSYKSMPSQLQKIWKKMLEKYGLNDDIEEEDFRDKFGMEYNRDKLITHIGVEGFDFFFQNWFIGISRVTLDERQKNIKQYDIWN